jgi:cell division protein FtsZ
VTGLDRPRAPGAPAEKIEPTTMGVARPAQAAPAPAVAPAARPRPSETAERPQQNGAEEDMLDIPAFLRRQAN